MPYDRLMFIFGALFGLFGLPLVFLRDVGLSMVLGGLAMLSLACFAVTLGLRAIDEGQLRLQIVTVEKDTSPRLFWLSVALIIGAGAAVGIGAMWLILFEPVPK